MDTDWYKYGNNKDAHKLVIEYHYSKKVPTSLVCVCTQYRKVEPVAAVFFSNPPTRWSESVIELSRLVRREETEPKPILTKLISKGIKQCKRLGYNLIVSYADSTHGHFGGIYQASSWNFHIKRGARSDGWLIDGELIPRRTCFHRWGTSGKALIPLLIAEGKKSVEIHYDKGKYLYWKSLDKNGERKAERLGLTKSPYPKLDE